MVCSLRFPSHKKCQTSPEHWLNLTANAVDLFETPFLFISCGSVFFCCYSYISRHHLGNRYTWDWSDKTKPEFYLTRLFQMTYTISCSYQRTVHYLSKSHRHHVYRYCARGKLPLSIATVPLVPNSYEAVSASVHFLKVNNTGNNLLSLKTNSKFTLR